jgi:putative acetyltransferase
VDVRAERESDQAAVDSIVTRAFGDHGEAVAGLLADLRAALTPDNGLSLVAEDSGVIVGHLLFSRSLLDTPRELVEVQVVSPVAVLPERQRTGIGSALVRAGLAMQRERSFPVVFLEGSPAYYSRLGFMPGAELGFRKPSLRIPDAAFQAITMPTYEAWMTGTLVYSETFWRHDAVGLR